ncbi:MAG: Rrf2 family transcriptional regulator [Clostridia bacterium]|nr:Rrf2 family transcriptional regulator [Clostridia bacterium]
MMISTKGRYALRVMLDLAEHEDGSYIPLKDVALRQNISRKYLENIMSMMTKNNLVTSATGKEGGYRLNRDPGDYVVGDILRATEGDLAPVACLSESEKKCTTTALCYTLPFWQGLEEHINSYIDSYTLQDLMDSKEQVIKNFTCR